MPATTLNNTQVASPRDFVDRSLDLAGKFFGVVLNADLPDAALKSYELAKTLVTKGSLSELNRNVQNLEKAAPDSVKVAQEAAQLFKEVAAAMPQDIGSPYEQELVKSVQKTASSFSLFSKSYEWYLNINPPPTWNPWTWAGNAGYKMSAGWAVVRHWEEFKVNYKDTQEKIDAVAADYGVPDYMRAKIKQAFDFQ